VVEAVVIVQTKETDGKKKKKMMIKEYCWLK
jgi:hypothetical protein